MSRIFSFYYSTNVLVFPVPISGFFLTGQETGLSFPWESFVPERKLHLRARALKCSLGSKMPTGSERPVDVRLGCVESVVITQTPTAAARYVRLRLDLGNNRPWI